jgi:threonine dehydrogenase-like Zn-dependent dehydrogenase
MKTRQAVLVAPRRFEIRDAEIAPAEGQVLVRMEGCGMCTSEMPQWLGLTSDYPYVLGHEAWGQVVAVGPDTPQRIREGDRVTGLGIHCYGDYYCQPAEYTMVLRADLEQRCVLGEPFYCVHNVLRAAHPRIGDAVAVVGAGPMGQWTLQGLAGPTLQSLIALDIDDRKLRLAREAGATHAIDPDAEDAVERVRRITGGRMADVVVEGTGVQAGMDVAVRLLRRGRPRLVVMSFFKHPIEVDVTRLCGVAAEVIHAHPGIRKDRPDGCRRTEVLINNGVFRADHLITHRFGLEQIQAAFECFEARPTDYVKGIVTP